ncbi:MAG: hypothetical protein DKINENOH_04530 [bacterium]|nr:hypothetical protein [bacterium]
MKYLFEAPTKAAPPPDELAYVANDVAVRARDAEESYANLRASAEQEARHPAHQPLYEASRSRRILIYGILAIPFVLVVLWEWEISRPIYEVFFPAAPMLALFCCIAVAFYASICLGECSSHFSFLNSDEAGNSTDDDIVASALEVLYGSPKPTRRSRRWFFSPAMGALIATLFLSGIYLASRERVLLQVQAGELPSGAMLQEYLPVILYAVDILLGIPTFFFIAWLWTFWRNRKLTKTLDRERGCVLDLRRIAVSKYSEYLTKLAEYNATRPSHPRRALVPPNNAMRQLLIDEFGFDPTLQGGASPPENKPLAPVDVPPQNDNRPPTEGTVDTSPPENKESQREQDLLSLLDEQINSANRTL